MDELLHSELSSSTLAALRAHLQEVSEEKDNTPHAVLTEDFRLSQLYVFRLFTLFLSKQKSLDLIMMMIYSCDILIIML